ncbi:MAG: hypothetical protein JO333_20965 [Verrucomicrobia bacterium]|nr:hypothetical protein [Verrucomicrobiota bacterium]
MTKLQRRNSEAGTPRPQPLVTWLAGWTLLLTAFGTLSAQTTEPVPEASPWEPPTEQSRPAVPQESPNPIAPVQVPSNPITDAARYLAGLPVADSSAIAPLTRTPGWQAHANVMNAAFATLERRQLSNIRIWRSDFLAPVTAGIKTCVYYFGGPDFLYADTFFPDCSTYILVGLESIDSIPDLSTVPALALENTLQNIQISLNTLLQFSFFKTKDMREDFGRGELKGVLPILLVFLARTGKDIESIEYISLDRNGEVTKAGGPPHGVKITFNDPATRTEKVLYFISTDLSDGGLKSSPNILRFTEKFGPSNCFLKAASYLMHENSFSTVRSFLLRVAATILQDDSGIPIRYLSQDEWTLRFFGAYNGPIALFKQYFQSDLQPLYAASSPKALTFSFGYQWNRRNSTLILAAKK